MLCVQRLDLPNSGGALAVSTPALGISQAIGRGMLSLWGEEIRIGEKHEAGRGVGEEVLG